MKKLSLLISLLLCVTIGGVYATWVYSQSSDVADITGAKAITMTEATFTGTYGTYSVDTSNLTMVVDPKEGTSHTTSLKIEGNLVISFTPNTHAPVEIKTTGVETYFTFSMSNSNWQYSGQNILSINKGQQTIKTIGNATTGEKEWTLSNGVLTYTISAEELATFFTLTEFVLDTKADYDAYDAVLTNGQIVISISDGQSTTV